MIWGLTASTFTLVHVLLSLIGIGAGLIVMAGVELFVDGGMAQVQLLPASSRARNPHGKDQ